MRKGEVRTWSKRRRSAARVAAGVVLAGAALVFSGAALAANPTKLSISCTPRDLSPGVAAACAVTVTDACTACSRSS